MGAEFHAFAVAVEHRRVDRVGQHGADEDRVALERRHDDALGGGATSERSSICWIEPTGAPW
jgi:hypothetical protein